MTPVTAAYAVALLILTKVVETTGEEIGKEVFQSGRALWKTLYQKKPEIADAIKQIAENSDLSRSEKRNLTTVEIVNDV